MHKSDNFQQSVLIAAKENWLPLLFNAFIFLGIISFVLCVIHKNNKMLRAASSEQVVSVRFWFLISYALSFIIIIILWFPLLHV